jgi:hypothetical protein
MNDELRRLLAPLLAQRLAPAQHLALAAALRELAAQEERLAEATRRDAARPAPARISGSGRRTGRPGAMTLYIRYYERPDRHEPIVSLRLGRGLYDDYQDTRPDPLAPLRLTVEVRGASLYLVEAPEGYAVAVSQGGVWMTISGSRDYLGGIVPLRRYPAEIQRGRIVADLSGEA